MTLDLHVNHPLHQIHLYVHHHNLNHRCDMKSKITQDKSGAFPRMLQLTLTDGHSRFSAVEYTPVPSLK